MQFEPTFQDLSFQTGKPIVKGVYTQIGNKRERNMKFERLNKLNILENCAVENNPYRNINKSLFYSHFNLSFTEIRLLEFEYEKRANKYVGQRPVLFASLLYWLGVPIHDVVNLLKDFHRINVSLLLRMFYALKLKRLQLNDSAYWVRRFSSYFNADLQKRIEKAAPMFLKLKLNLTPKNVAAGIIYACLKAFGYSQSQVAKILNTTEPIVRDSFQNIKHHMHIVDRHYTTEKARDLIG